LRYPIENKNQKSTFNYEKKERNLLGRGSFNGSSGSGTNSYTGGFSWEAINQNTKLIINQQPNQNKITPRCEIEL
jgi:hypothetical protein